MENYIVSARKYRPTEFDSVVGQASITRTLENAIKNHHLAQAFLFSGPRGVGKTTCARILAKRINLEADKNLKEDDDLSFNIFELDAASNNSVDDIRHLNEQVRIPPQVGSYRVFIIDEVHMLSLSAFNAFLKTLEEPPPHAIFILATTEKHKIIPTILSRCQVFDFKRIEIDGIISQLEKIAKSEKIEAEHDALHIIAQKADGAMRDALSIFDQLVSFCGKKLTYDDVIENLNVLDYDYYFKVGEAMLEGNIPSALVLFNEVLQKGFDGHNFINGLSSHFRNLLVCKDVETLSLLEVGPTIQEKYKQQSKSIDTAVLLQALRITAKCDVQYKLSKNQRLLVEVTLMQLCSVKSVLEKKKTLN
ncbi:MAG: DNA polymerase III subunit gamma/tau [Flavobacteriales bacterium]|nr:DNA polymerase III subunit gamma/tau [Flavobacteriales bacterium]